MVLGFASPYPVIISRQACIVLTVFVSVPKRITEKP